MTLIDPRRIHPIRSGSRTVSHETQEGFAAKQKITLRREHANYDRRKRHGGAHKNQNAPVLNLFLFRFG